MRIKTPNGSPSLRTAEGPEARRRLPVLQQAVIAFVLVLMASLGAGLLLAAAVMAGLD
jgi:hypothetical protein